MLLLQPLHAQFGPAVNPLADGAARVVALEGAVSLQKPNLLWALNVGDIIQVQQVVVTGADGYARFEVADGSTFEVFPSSRVTFRNNPGDWRDLVDVWLGRIRVHIQKLGGMPNPNRVQTPTAIISVRGTVFDVAVTDDDETTTVTVAEGQVAVMHRLMHREGGLKVLNAGDEITVYRNVPLSAARRLDKQRFVQYAGEALWQIMLRGPRIGGSGSPTPTGTGGGTPPSQPLPGDTESTPPPP
ncbi:MAG: FecR domain-containing protein, partial [Bryobacteraceae bacterium]|nr:FecR domain-containing protein [Bryobacteraceae bacterium]